MQINHAKQIIAANACCEEPCFLYSLHEECRFSYEQFWAYYDSIAALAGLAPDEPEIAAMIHTGYERILKEFVYHFDPRDVVIDGFPPNYNDYIERLDCAILAFETGDLSLLEDRRFALQRQNTDMTLPCADGLVNLRVGAIICKDGKVLMVGNDHSDYLYSVGGRIQFGETAEEAVVREVFEETGTQMEIDRLGFVHENYFYGDCSANQGKLIYEIAFYFYMKVPDGFTPVAGSCNMDQHKEHLHWVTADDPRQIYPAFFRTALNAPSDGITHLVTDERVPAT